LSPKLVNITQLRSNCRIVIPLPHISVKAFPPQATGNVRRKSPVRFRLVTKAGEYNAIAQQLPDCYAPSAHFRESAPAAMSGNAHRKAGGQFFRKARKV
jgi:hypothetical protein